jgi:hypothetical protein
VAVLVMAKARRWLWALATTKDYEHSTIEALVTVMHDSNTPCLIDLHLAPAPALLERHSRGALRRREQRLKAESGWSATEPGVDSVVAQKHLKGALDATGRALFCFELRILTPRSGGPLARHLAGVLQETRADNHLRAHTVRLRRRACARAVIDAAPTLRARPWRAVLSSAELASLWHLPTLRVKGAGLARSGSRQVTAPDRIDRRPEHALLCDDRGPLGLRPQDRRYGWLLLGAPGGGKTAALARHVAAVARDPSRALIVIDPKEDFARLCLSLIPADRHVHYLDLAHPRWGLNILTAGALSPQIRADTLISVIRELSGDSAIGPRSDLLLRAAITAVCTVEATPHSSTSPTCSTPYTPDYRAWVVRELADRQEVDFLRHYWSRTFPAMLAANRRFVAEAVAAPHNKLARFLTSPALSLLSSHPRQLDLERLVAQRQVLIVNGAKGTVGEDNATLVCAMLVVLVQKLLHRQQTKDTAQRPPTSLVIDEAHNVFTPSFATMLAEGRSGGLEVAAAFQYTAQITDERVRAGVKSLLQNISIFRLREFDDARAAAALAMEIYTDAIGADTPDQRRLRLDPIDIVNQPNYRCVNLWLSDGIPQPAFTANTLPMEPLTADPGALAARRHHETEQRRRGHHPHDTGVTITPPLVWSTDRPIVARWRELHVDLPAWPDGPPPETVARLAVVLTAPRTGRPHGFLAAPTPGTGRRRWQATVPSDPGQPGWLASGPHAIHVLVWCDGRTQPRSWTSTEPNGEPLTVDLADPPRLITPARA